MLPIQQTIKNNDWLKTVINVVLFQLCWLACVVGGNQWALAALLLLVVIHASWIVGQDQLLSEVRLVLPLISLGILFDTILMQIEWLIFPHDSGVTIPFWLMALWLAFASTVRHSMSGILKKPWVAVLFGALGAPWSYYLGDQLGAVTVTTNALIAISLFWGLLLLAVCVQLQKTEAADGSF
ncbi:DUF2878 domain-containing protein [Bacterioplanoides sp.]|uniref:DUF2878 domain-containing protein n=1 Tax=Bacterioplanoides sp. TaxID=2066072 RepID=UPI003AFFFDFC